MSDGRNIKKVLGKLALALLNATLLLALALTVMVWLVLGRVQDLTDSTQAAVATALAPQSAKMDRLVASVENIDEKLQAGVGNNELRSEIAGLTGDIQALRTDLATVKQIGPEVFLDRVLTAVSALLSQNRPSDPS